MYHVQGRLGVRLLLRGSNGVLSKSTLAQSIFEFTYPEKNRARDFVKCRLVLTRFVTHISLVAVTGAMQKQGRNAVLSKMIYIYSAEMQFCPDVF